MASPDTFSFPYPPYGIQLEFMQRLHACLDESGIGFFESPTGTGKSLSLVCGLLSWLEKQREPPVTPAPGTHGALSDPLEAHMSRVRMQDAQRLSDEERQRRADLRRVISDAGVASWAEGATASYAMKTKTKKSKVDENDDDWLLDDVHLHHDMRESSPSSGVGTRLPSSVAPLRIYYTSRTHTQLAQFIGELRKTRYTSDLFLAPMGSRSTLCVHAPVKSLASVSAMNDACQDLREKKGGCPCNRKDEVERLALRGLGTVADIEDLAGLGLKSGVCSYFASRRMMPLADLIVLPYQMLFHKATREALGVFLENSIVVVDEAHNIVDAINSVYSVQISQDQVRAVKCMVAAYLDRYRQRLSASNLVMLRQIESFVARLDAYLTSCDGNDTLFSVSQFLVGIQNDGVNLFPLLRWIRETHIGNVMRGFGAAIRSDGTLVSNLEMLNGSFHAFTSFLEALTTQEGDGRVLLRREDRGTWRVEFLLLSPEQCFIEMARKCRSIVLAGGTLSPIPALTKQLLAERPDLTSRVHAFACGHIVSANNLMVLPITTGPTDRVLDFSFKSRDEAMLVELISLIANVRSVSPAGMVVFFPSYALEAQFFDLCHRRGALARMGNLFRNDTFESYAKLIHQGQKAMLWAVIGGTLSEGINFNDDLGRCVMVIGVPYPNAKDVVLQEKLERLGQDHYTAIAARSLNQSIGRAIRHISDFATVLLVDARYRTLAREWIPSWMIPSLEESLSFGHSIAKLVAFYKKHPTRRG